MNCFIPIELLETEGLSPDEELIASSTTIEWQISTLSVFFEGEGGITPKLLDSSATFPPPAGDNDIFSSFNGASKINGSN